MLRWLENKLKFEINITMPYSHPSHREAIKQFISDNFDPIIQILDVGAGAGSYRDLLPNPIMDALEIYAKYIEDFDLKNKYRKVFNENAVSFKYKRHQLAILGDVVQTLEIEDAKKIFTALRKQGTAIIVQVPFLYEQGPYDGNVNETHIQADLTNEVFLERYAEFDFKLLTLDEVCGVYYIK